MDKIKIKINLTELDKMPVDFQKPRNLYCNEIGNLQFLTGLEVNTFYCVGLRNIMFS